MSQSRMGGGKRGRKGSLSEVKVVLIRLSRFVRNCHHVYQVRGGGEGQKAEGSASVGFLGNNVIGHCPRATKERSIIFSHQVSGAAGEGGKGEVPSDVAVILRGTRNYNV